MVHLALREQSPEPKDWRKAPSTMVVGIQLNLNTAILVMTANLPAS
jgi:hypothetical protein